MEGALFVILEFLFGGIGAGIRWLLERRKRKYKEVLEDKIFVNTLIGLFIIVIIILIFKHN